MKLFSKKTEEDKAVEEIISMVNSGNEQGIIEDSEAQLIANVFEFTDKEAKDVMTARTSVVAIDSAMNMEQIKDFMLDNNYSRYPVYEGDIDNIVGIIYFKDFVKAYLRNRASKVSGIMVEAVFVHPTYNIAKLFGKMQTAKIHMVVVVDEYGQTEGIVTMEDILEEIVGNILDEYDDANDDIKKRGDTYIIKGMAQLDEVADALGIEFPDEDFQTLNGFLLYELGRLPYPKEDVEIVYQNYKFASVSITSNMIDLVRVTKLQ
jgi:putative hemolysin